MTFRTQILKGFGWTAGSRVLGQILTWCVTIVVMRILAPADYGLLAMATVLVTFLSLFAEMGIGGAIVQSRDVDTMTMRSVLGMVVLVNLALFAITVALAPAVSAFYGQEHLTLICQVLALQFPISALGVIPDALLQRKLEFKWRSILDLSAVLIQSGTTLGLALSSFGVWSLVVSSLVGALWRVLGLNFLAPFLHAPRFDFNGLGRLFSFGGWVVVARILGNISNQADTVIGGRALGQEQIGYYSVGMDLASLPMQRVAAIMNTVAFPAVAAIQNDERRIADYLVRGMRLLNLLTFPVFWGMASVAPELVGLLLGSKWAPAVLPLQLLALVVPVRMAWQLMPPILLGMGKARLVAINHVVLFVVMGTAFGVGVQFGLLGLSAAWLIALPTVYLINLRTWLTALQLRASDILLTAWKPALGSAAMAACIAAARTLGFGGPLAALLALVGVGAVSYLGLMWILDRPAFQQVFALFKK